MSKRIILILGVLIFQFLFNYSYSKKETFNNKRYIVWEESINLSWSDFLKRYGQNTKYIVKNGIKASAFISVSISYSFERDVTENIFICYIQTILDKKESWSYYASNIEKDSCGSNLLLRHELGHFNILEIYAREGRMLVSKIKVRSFDKAYNEVQKIIQKIRHKRTLEQDKYDEETGYGVNKEKQAEWDKKIAERLKELEQYKDTKVIVRLRK
ncbi:MAG: hypothetical protein LBR81_07525 [Prevotellaceae bacterium]|jgi:hypothetical protein|nr:hypothetical protein [Prevotellaceae bacterium]